MPSLNTSQVTVTDSSGALLAAGGADNDGGMSGSVEEQKIAAEARIRHNVEEIVGRIVGADNVRVNVASEMDFSRITESAEIVDPDSQTVLSSTTVEETSNSSDPAIGQGVSVANALPGAQPFAQNDQSSTSSQQRTEETTNYEISKTVRNAVRDEGLVVKRLSVAVAVNGAATPISEDQIARIETLVKSAIGFSEARGDIVSVVDVPFSETPAIAAGALADAPSALAREDLMRIAEIVALGAIALALIVFVLRPMLKASDTPAASLAPASLGTTNNTSQAVQTAIAHQTESALEQRIDLAQVDGQVKASSVKKVSEIVKSHTDESAGILRNWMREAS